MAIDPLETTGELLDPARATPSGPAPAATVRGARGSAAARDAASPAAVLRRPAFIALKL